MSGFKVPGSLTVTKQSLDSVETTSWFKTYLHRSSLPGVRAPATAKPSFSPTSFSVCMTSTRRSPIRPLVRVEKMNARAWPRLTSTLLPSQVPSPTSSLRPLESLCLLVLSPPRTPIAPSSALSLLHYPSPA